MNSSRNIPMNAKYFFRYRCLITLIIVGGSAQYMSQRKNELSR